MFSIHEKIQNNRWQNAPFHFVFLMKKLVDDYLYCTLIKTERFLHIKS